MARQISLNEEDHCVQITRMALKDLSSTDIFFLDRFTKDWSVILQHVREQEYNNFVEGYEEGFLTNEGEFLNKEEALEHAKKWKLLADGSYGMAGGWRLLGWLTPQSLKIYYTQDNQ